MCLVMIPEAQKARGVAMGPIGSYHKKRVSYPGFRIIIKKWIYMISSSLKIPYIKDICHSETFFFLFRISKFSSFARNTTLIKKCTTAEIPRNEIFRLRVFSDLDSICNTLKNAHSNQVQYHIVFFDILRSSEIPAMFMVNFGCFLIRFRLRKYAQSTDLGQENRSSAAVVHFFIRVVFLAELENFEIIKRKKT